MKTIIITICMTLIFMLAGCVSAKYNPETNEVSYLRIGAQKLGGVTIQTADGTIVIIEAQESQAKLFNDALSLIEKGIEIGSR